MKARFDTQDEIYLKLTHGLIRKGDATVFANVNGVVRRVRDVQYPFFICDRWVKDPKQSLHDYMMDGGYSKVYAHARKIEKLTREKPHGLVGVRVYIAPSDFYDMPKSQA